MTTLDTLLAFIDRKHEISADDCAQHLGIGLNQANRAMIGDELRRAGWRKYRVRRNGALCFVFRVAPAIDTELFERETALRKYLKEREKVTIEECCYAQLITPHPEIKAEIAAHLKRWRWVRVSPIVRGRLEWRRRGGLTLGVASAGR